MAIITISRGSFSGGVTVAECLAKQLGYRLLSREVISAAAARYGVAEEKLAEAFERPPGLWDRFGHERRRYLLFIQAALCDAIDEDEVVYHGHAGHLLLRGVGHVLRVRLIAPLPAHIGAVMERLHLDRAAAEAHVVKVDEERARWTRFLYGVDWNAPQLYDLIVNLEMFRVETACHVIGLSASELEFQPTAASRKAIRDLRLGCRVRAALAASPVTGPLEFEVTADGDTVTLSGRLRSEDQALAAVDLAARVPGVATVKRDHLGAWRYGPY